MRRSPSWRSEERLLDDQIKDVETGIRQHRRSGTPSIILSQLELRLKQLQAERERLRWRG